jgi:hypothetical protein
MLTNILYAGGLFELAVLGGLYWWGSRSVAERQA